MANTTIYPYGTSGQLPSGIGIIDDLVTGGSDKALSAQQGVVLNQMIQEYLVGGSATFTDVEEDGFYVVDAAFNIGFAFDGTSVFPSAALNYDVV